VRNLSDTIARLKRLLLTAPNVGLSSSRLAPLGSFGPNPGQLKAWTYVPENVASRAPLVVVLHGCTQNAAGYDDSSGWSRLADLHGFVLLYPEQQRSNNPNLCFNWFSPVDTARGKGEVCSIREMVMAVQARHDTDPRQVFVTGLSAGGAMASATLATYPDVFAGGAVIGGLPFGVARSVPEAFDRMRGHGGPPAAKLANLVRAASSQTAHWPTLSVWHGTADQTVDQSNASALVEQWRGLHEVPETPSKIESVNGNSHRVWRDGAGRDVIEEYLISGLGHGTPLDTHTSDHGEKAAPFMLEAGISSTRLIADFWGIVPIQAHDGIRTASAPSWQAVEQRTRTPEFKGELGIRQTIEGALRSAGLMK
jgi:poly(hydroxyalkanoate) depolymerase family esterase